MKFFATQTRCKKVCMRVMVIVAPAASFAIGGAFGRLVLLLLTSSTPSAAVATAPVKPVGIHPQAQGSLLAEHFACRTRGRGCCQCF